MFFFFKKLLQYWKIWRINVVYYILLYIIYPTYEYIRKQFNKLLRILVNKFVNQLIDKFAHKLPYTIRLFIYNATLLEWDEGTLWNVLLETCEITLTDGRFEINDDEYYYRMEKKYFNYIWYTFIIHAIVQFMSMWLLYKHESVSILWLSWATESIPVLIFVGYIIFIILPFFFMYYFVRNCVAYVIIGFISLTLNNSATFYRWLLNRPPLTEEERLEPYFTPVDDETEYLSNYYWVLSLVYWSVVWGATLIIKFDPTLYIFCTLIYLALLLIH